MSQAIFLMVFGGGPAGLTLSWGLRRHGFSCPIIDQVLIFFEQISAITIQTLTSEE